MVKINAENGQELNKILVAAKYANVKVEVVHNEKDASKSPNGKLPYAETEKGILFETNAIARHVARQGQNLFGADSFENSLVDQWISFVSSELVLPLSVWVFPTQGKIPNNEQAVTRAKNDVKASLMVLNKHLTSNTYLVGHRVTLADIIVALALFDAYTLVFDANYRKAFPNVTRWFLTCVNQPNFASVVGAVTLPEKAAEPKPVVVKEQPKKEEKKPKEEKPKEEKPKPKPKDDDEEEEEEDYEDKKPKKVNPLDLLPPSTLVLDEWKRQYSNNDTRTVAIPWFWQNFDASGFSLWMADYKYNDENEVLFKTCNLVGGMLQRLDQIRKYAFGNVVIFGQDKPFEISAVWMFRGQEVPDGFKEADDYELYNWRKMDSTNADDKELVGDFWAWDGKFGGRKFNQAKTFK